MDPAPQLQEPEPAAADRPARQDSSPPSDTPAIGTAATAVNRLAARPSVALGPGALLALQQTVGNRAVQRLVASRATQPAAGPDATAWTKVLGQEEELEGFAKIVGQEEELTLAKSLPPESTADGVGLSQEGDGCGPGCRCALCSLDIATAAAPSVQDQEFEAAGIGRVATDVTRTEPRPGTVAVPERELLAKAVLDVQSGAPGSVPLGDRTYGMTYPEYVTAEIGASLDVDDKKWNAVVKKLTGHYSQRTRLLPGQTELTGPGGNTTKANYCAQCENLSHLGNLPVRSHPWYVLSAVVAHENVHLTRFKPGLEDAEAAMTIVIEDVTVPHDDVMTEAEAIAKLQAAGAYRAALKSAYRLWLARCAARVSGDHAPGGPTDAAEKLITEPLRASICAHARAKKWPACESCS